MTNKKIIMAGLSNNKTSLGEVFRRYVSCFQTFSTPDIYDLSTYIKNNEFRIEKIPQYEGKLEHNIRYFHTPFDLYGYIKSKTVSKPKDDSRKIGYFVWESSELYKKDADILKDFDEIWTASSYCKDIFSQYIDDSRINVVPHPIPAALKTYKKYANFTILVIGNLSSNIDRKNIIDNLEVAKIVKSKHKNVNIIFKTFTVNSHEKTLVSNITGNNKIKVIDEYFPSEKVQELVGKCHVVLSLHRSEGFGLTLAEAMAVNTIPVATGYSGNTDFMKDSRLLVDYKLADTNINHFRGQWAIPDKDDAIDKLSSIINKDITISNQIPYIEGLSYENISSQIKTSIV
jgi:glycosyltransferase involved in cell wall biosynthesis